MNTNSSAKEDGALALGTADAFTYTYVVRVLLISGCLSHEREI